MSEIKIKKGSRVTLYYTLSLADGKVADSTKENEPLTIVLGESDLLPAFEHRLLGLQAGDKRRFEIPCMEAYGPSEADNVHALPREEFPPDMKLEAGLVIGFETPSGEEVPGTILEVSEKDVSVDFSHPLAGHDLVFEVEILDVEPPE